MTGVSVFADPDEAPLPETRTRPAGRAAGARPAVSLSAEAATDPDRLFPELVEAATRGAGVAELAGALSRLDDGRCPAIEPLPRHRDAEDLEAPADDSAAAAARGTAAPGARQ